MNACIRNHTGLLGLFIRLRGNMAQCNIFNINKHGVVGASRYSKWRSEEEKMQWSFLNGDSASYLESMYDSWSRDPQSVSHSWQQVFNTLSHSQQTQKKQKQLVASPSIKTAEPAPSIIKHAPSSIQPAPSSIKPEPEPELDELDIPTESEQEGVGVPSAGGGPASDEMSVVVDEHGKLQEAVKSYQWRGHLMADIDPLRIWRSPRSPPLPQEFNLRQDQPLYLLPEETFIGRNDESVTLSEALGRLHDSYCGSIGLEFVHLLQEERRNWLAKAVEESPFMQHSTEEKRRLLENLLESHILEKSIEEIRPRERRFGLQGCEVLLPAIKATIEVALDKGAHTFNIGMGRRGRLNVLANVVGVDVKEIMSQFSGVDADAVFTSGENIYQRGASMEHTCPKRNRQYRISLLASYPHMGLVNSLVLGRTSAQQVYHQDMEGIQVWPILLHGDAALYGEGISYETFQMCELESFKNNGAIHFIIDNQIGFNTLSRRYKGSEYCSDIGKAIGIPIFHVNGDDVEAVIKVVKIAAEYRAKFKAHVLVDLVCYRRYGVSPVSLQINYNQQAMMEKIKNLQPVYIKYKQTLINNKVITEEEAKKMETDYKSKFDAKMADKTTSIPSVNVWTDSALWHKMMKRDEGVNPFMSGVDKSVLEHVAGVFSTIPDDIKPSRSLERVLRVRKEMIKNNSLDWATAEALAIGSLLMEGHRVRMCGQDAQRGTFSHRHHVWHDTLSTSKKTYVPLHHLDKNQALYTVCNSFLSEQAVLGFEYGYSTFNPNDVVIWEAQFGDFINGAQAILDSYIASGETRWNSHSALVILLPHGMEGQGPEHSSARPERMLSLCSEPSVWKGEDMLQQLRATNLIVANPTSPANYFHVLRRQLKMPFAKPLIVLTPKSLLRHPKARSPFEHMAAATEFQPYLGEERTEVGGVKKVLLCSGKVYYELWAEREARGLKEQLALGRVEQLSPFPYRQLSEDLARYPTTAKISWVQEEHKNHGSWSYVCPRIYTTIGNTRTGDAKIVEYAGRKPSASPATGNKVAHLKQRELMIEKAMSLK